jgi:hypothetical protein
MKKGCYPVGSDVQIGYFLCDHKRVYSTSPIYVNCCVVLGNRVINYAKSRWYKIKYLSMRIYIYIYIIFLNL